MRRRRALFGAIGAAALLLLLGRWSTGLYTDYLWFASLGAASVWRARALTSGALVCATFAAAALFAFANLYAVRQSVVSLVLPRRIANIEIGEEVPGRYLTQAAALLAGVIGAVTAIGREGWSRALLAFAGVPFGESDPYFGADLGFFVHWLPFEQMLHAWAVITLTTVTGVVILLYALTPSLRWERGTLHVSAYVRRHFMVLGGAVLLALAWSYRLSMYRLLATGGGDAGIFTSIDHRVVVPATFLLALVTLCAAVVVGWAGWSGQMRVAFLAVSAVLVLSLLGRTVAPLAARQGTSPAESAVQERRYLATRLGYTRRAFGIDRIVPDTLGAGFAAPLEAAARASMWDGATLARALARSRAVTVVGSGVGWQTVAGELTALLVERVPDDGGGSTASWGLVRFAATHADERGMPVRVPPARLAEERLRGEPAVYDSAPAYSVLADSARELTGVEMTSTRSRLAHAWSLQNFRLLFGDLPDNRPTMVRRRDVRERVAVLAPFLVQGSEIVPVVALDSLYWTVELYASAWNYPLSQRFTVLGEERGYFQHAATAIVHAASGSVRMLVATAPDPVAATWAMRFPTLFVGPRALPPALLAALPPAVDGARAQALAFGAAGFRGDSLEARHFPDPDGADSSAAREPLRVALTRDGPVAALWPLLDSRDRLRGLISAVGGAERATSWIPVAGDSVRWGLLLDRMRAADTVMRESGTVRGSLRALPVAGRALYFQPTFVARSGGVPSLARVTVLEDGRIRQGATLTAALGGAGLDTLRPLRPADIRARADTLHRAMRDALSRGDWLAFGRAFDALGAAVRSPAP